MSFIKSSETLPKLNISFPPVVLLLLKIPSRTLPFSPSINGSIIQNSMYCTFVLSKSVSLEILLVIAPKLVAGFLSKPDEVKSGL